MNRTHHILCKLLIAAASATMVAAVKPASRPAAITDAELAKTLIGSWRIVDAHRNGKPSELHYTAVTIKHITPTQFTWLSYRPNDRKIFRSMGGSWRVEDGKYLETPQYGTQNEFVEKIYDNVTSIGCEIEGDVFTQTIVGKDGSKFIEVWKRMIPGEDSREVPRKK